MKMIRKWIREVFGFSGTEINGFIVLIPLLLIAVFSQPLYRSWLASNTGNSLQDSLKLDSLIALWHDIDDVEEEVAAVEKFSLFEFDPNTADVADLRKLGFDESSSNRIAAYRRKGGVFRLKSDLLRIYGMDSTLYKQLYNHIRLPARRITVGRERRTLESSRTLSRDDEAVTQKIDINTADTLLFKSIYGIGSRLAVRIIRFREALGGFISTAQLFEVYGLDSMTVKEMLDVCYVQTGFVPQRININNADMTKLSAHPYIRHKMARLVVSYRFQHGDFAEVSDLKKLSVIPANELERLLPYLKVKD